jgi:hypothetical protein
MTALVHVDAALTGSAVGVKMAVGAVNGPAPSLATIRAATLDAADPFRAEGLAELEPGDFVWVGALAYDAAGTESPPAYLQVWGPPAPDAGGGAVAVDLEGAEILATATRIDFRASLSATGLTGTDQGGGAARVTVPVFPAYPSDAGTVPYALGILGGERAWRVLINVTPGTDNPYAPPPSPHGAHSYWRVYVPANRTQNGIWSVGEVQFRAAAGGPDQATGGTASAFSAASPAGNAFDDDAATPSASTDATRGQAQWVRYAFAAPVEVAQVYLAARNDIYGPDEGAGALEVQYSDNGTTWATAWAVSPVPVWAAGEARTFTDPAVSGVTPPAGSPTGHAYWRVYAVSTWNGYASASEVEFRATSGGADQAVNGHPFAAARQGDNVARLAFDNDDNTFWAMNPATHKWIAYHFPSPVDVTELRYRARGDVYGGPEAPSELRVEYSDDGATWSTHWTVSGIPGWTNGESRVFTKP